MAKIQIAGETHKVVFVPLGNRLIRGCINCGASWELVPVGGLDSTKYAWKPIAEVDADGKDITKFTVDINNCEHIEDEAPTKPAPTQRGFAAVESAANRRGVKAVCYCDDCKGKTPHWQDDDRCFCKSCRGKKSHYAA